MCDKVVDYNRWVRISVDDVIVSLKRIYETHPKSVFDEVLFRNLMRFHVDYDLIFELFVFEECEGFVLSDLQDVYWEEFARNANWIKFGWHGRNISQKKELDANDISSFERVYRLLTNKLPKQCISEVGCVHRYAGNSGLLENMKERGTGTFYTSHFDNTRSYLLDEKENMELLLNGTLEKDSVWFLRRDICIDEFKNNKEGLLCEYKAKSNRYPHKYQMVLFFHENEIEYIIDSLKYLLDWIPEYNHAFCLNASTLVGEYIYFTDLHTQCLYRIGIDGKRIDRLIRCPEWKWGMKFTSLMGYENEIWMFPREEDAIYIYDIQLNTLEKLPIPHQVAEKVGVEKYRKPVMYNENFWLVTPKSKVVEKICPHDRTVSVYRNMPEEINFVDDSLDFLNVSVHKNKIMAFRKGANKNIEVDLESELISTNEINTEGAFAELSENKLYLSPVRRGGKIRIIDLNTSERKEIELPEYIWVDKVKWNSYWYVKELSEYVFFMPLEANAILYISKADGTVNTIDIRNIKYTTQDIDKYFGLFDIYEQGSYIYAAMFCGDTILKISQKDMSVETIRLAMKVKDRRRDMWFIEPDSIYYETKDFGLTDFFQSMTIKKSNWAEVIRK